MESVFWWFMGKHLKLLIQESIPIQMKISTNPPLHAYNTVTTEIKHMLMFHWTVSFFRYQYLQVQIVSFYFNGTKYGRIHISLKLTGSNT